jgi:outer membrane protein OmpA-like peptidoglycan-associated protein
MWDLLTMSVQNRLFQSLSCLLFACCVSTSAVKADCADLLGQFNTAISNRSLRDAKAVEARIAVDAGCGNYSNEVKRQRATLEMIMVQQLMDKNAPPSDYEGLLLEASEVLWRGASLLGDLRFSKRKFSEATVAYERAIEIIKNVGLTPSPPDAESIKLIFDRAIQSRMLAANEESGAGSATFVPAAKDHRDGTVGGTMSENIRGFRPTAIPIPVQFETASAKFSPVGQEAVNELLKALMQQRPAAVTLVGHTDERGEADYNMRLSDRRVQALAGFLKQNGVAAKIVTVAKGKTEPLPISDTSELSREDIWALNRRVVWKRD